MSIQENQFELCRGGELSQEVAGTLGRLTSGMEAHLGELAAIGNELTALMERAANLRDDRLGMRDAEAAEAQGTAQEAAALYSNVASSNTPGAAELAAESAQLANDLYGWQPGGFAGIEVDGLTGAIAAAIEKIAPAQGAVSEAKTRAEEYQAIAARHVGEAPGVAARL